MTTRDAADAATEGGFSLDRKQVALLAPIKELGLHNVSVLLHPEVEATIILNVARSVEEAELQSRGVNIADRAAEDEAQAEIEIAELFEDIGAAELDELAIIDGDEAEDHGPIETVEDAADVSGESPSEDNDKD